MEGHVTYELNIEVWLIVDVTCPSVTFMYRYGRTNDDSLTNKAFISIDSSFSEKLGLFFADLCWPLYFSIFFIYLWVRYKEDFDPAHLFALNPLVDSISIGIFFTINEQLNIWTDCHEELQ